MSKRDIYTVKHTAIITGWATYSIPEGDKIRHFVDGSADIEWDFDSVRDIEMGDAEFSHTDDDGEDDGEEAQNPRSDEAAEDVTFGDEFPF